MTGTTRTISGTPEAATDEAGVKVTYYAVADLDQSPGAPTNTPSSIAAADPEPEPEPEPPAPALSFSEEDVVAAAKGLSGVGWHGVFGRTADEICCLLTTMPRKKARQKARQKAKEDGEEGGEEVTLTYLISGDSSCWSLEYDAETRTISGTPTTEGEAEVHVLCNRRYQRRDV